MRSGRAIRALLGVVLGAMLFTASDAGGIVVIGLEGTHFPGIFQSTLNPNDTGFFDVTIDAVKNRSFMCHLMIQGQPDSISCQGTLSAANVFEVISRGGVFQVHGMLGPTGIFEAKYRFAGDEGTLVGQEQRMNRRPDPAVFGMFMGDFMSDTTMMGGMLDLGVSSEEMPANGLMMVTQTFVDETGKPVGMPQMFEFDVFASSDPCPEPGIIGQACPAHPFTLIGLSTMGDPGAFMVMGTVGRDEMGNFVAMGEYEYRPRGIGNTEIVDMGTFEVMREFIGDITPGSISSGPGQ